MIQRRKFLKRTNIKMMERILVALFCLIPSVLNGQVKTIPINISLFNESTAIPFTRFVTTPIHPGLQAGTEFDYKTSESTRLFQTADISYFYHNYLAQGIGLNSALGYEYRIKKGFAFTALLGIGYMHTFNTAEEYKLVNGRYIREADRGNSRLYPSLSFDLGYYFRLPEGNNPKIFLRYQAWVEYPYSPDFIPVMAHITLHLGIKFMIPTKTKSNG